MIARYLAILVSLVFLSGCTGMQVLYPAPPAENQACVKNPGMVLCRVASASGLTLEQWNDLFLDATLIPLAAGKVNVPVVIDVLDKMIFVLDSPDTAFNTKQLMAFLVDKYNLDPVAAVLITRRLDRISATPAAANLVLDKDSLLFIANSLRDQRAQFAMFYNGK